MLKIISTYLILLFTINATASVAKNDTCKGCHPQIYKEFMGSAHKKSTIFNDPIHKVIWDKHPGKKKDKYACAQCHTPSDPRIMKALEESTAAVPKDDAAQNEGISCITCHSIKSIESHAKSHDKMILLNNDKKRPTLYAASKDKRDTKVEYKVEKSFMGMFKSTTGSPYHDIDYSNKNFYTGNLCMGCHGHKENSHGQNVCTTEAKGAIDEKSNCITCHMPQVKGSATTIAISKKHTSHDFTGARNKPEMLSQYLKINFKQTNKGFEITLTNEATHNLLLHPLRLAKLNVRVNSGTTTKTLKSQAFYRILGHDGKPAMPWIATEIYKENMLTAGETRTIKYDTIVKSGDMVEAEFGFYLVNPKMQKKLNLIDNKEATKFNILKTEFFQVK